MNRTTRSSGHPHAQPAPDEQRVQSLLRQAAWIEADHLAGQGSFTEGVMRRLEEAPGPLAALNGRAPDAALQAGSPVGRVWTPDATGSAPGVWLSLPVGLLLATGLWLSASLLGGLDWNATWPLAFEDLVAGVPVRPPSDVPALQVARLIAGAVLTAWTAWVLWHTQEWMLTDGLADRHAGSPCGADTRSSGTSLRDDADPRSR